MNIEELKSLKEEIIENIKDLESINDCSGEEKIVLELIEFYEEEQQRRKSVTDEAVQRAIDLIENCGLFSIDCKTMPYPANEERTILTALRQMQQKTDVQEPCEHCSIVDQKNEYGRTFYKEFSHDTSMLTTLDDVHVQLAYSENTGWVLHLEDEGGDRMFDIKASNCPNCGRKLRKDEEK